jgi:hypothetical protein
MSELPAAERLRRRYAPDSDKPRQLVYDFRAEMAAADDDATRQALFDAAVDVAGGLVGDDKAALTGVVDALHDIAFPKTDVLAEGWRRLAVDRHPELQPVFDAIEAADSDAERSEIVLAAIASGRYDGDGQALNGLLALDPTVDQRLDAGDDLDALAERDRAESDRRLAEAAAAVNGTESPAQRMLREHLDAAETAETETVSANA